MEGGLVWGEWRIKSLVWDILDLTWTLNNLVAELNKQLDI